MNIGETTGSTRAFDPPPAAYVLFKRRGLSFLFLSPRDPAQSCVHLAELSETEILMSAGCSSDLAHLIYNFIPALPVYTSVCLHAPGTRVRGGKMAPTRARSPQYARECSLVCISKWNEFVVIVRVTSSRTPSDRGRRHGRIHKTKRFGDRRGHWSLVPRVINTVSFLPFDVLSFNAGGKLCSRNIPSREHSKMASFSANARTSA